MVYVLYIWSKVHGMRLISSLTLKVVGVLITTRFLMWRQCRTPACSFILYKSPYFIDNISFIKCMYSTVQSACRIICIKILRCFSGIWELLVTWGLRNFVFCIKQGHDPFSYKQILCFYLAYLSLLKTLICMLPLNLFQCWSFVCMDQIEQRRCVSVEWPVSRVLSFLICAYVVHDEMYMSRSLTTCFCFSPIVHACSILLLGSFCGTKHTYPQCQQPVELFKAIIQTWKFECLKLPLLTPLHFITFTSLVFVAWSWSRCHYSYLFSLEIFSY